MDRELPIDAITVPHLNLDLAKTVKQIASSERGSMVQIQHFILVITTSYLLTGLLTR